MSSTLSSLKEVITSTVTSSPTPTSTVVPPVSDAEQQERFSSLALFLVLTLLILSFWTSYYLKVKRITAVHETIVGLFAGMFVGLALRIGPGEQVQKMLSFSNTIMLNVLLPPIILASGYDLRQENFFRNFGTILIFAFAGTFISAIVVGVIVYVWSLLHLESISLTLLECLIFGSTLSATDPVTILAIFNTYKVDPKLYSVIFGESILNDAVSIVMFDTLSTFRGKDIYISSIFHGIGLFLIVFTFSMLLGVCFGLGCSLLLKHSHLSSYPQLESCLVALIAYTSYFFSNGVTMSGIVSLLFCGITLKHYAYHNMSRRTQRTTRYTFQTLANLSENFIFIYLGLSLFTQDELVYKPLFIIITILAVVASRYAAVFPIAGAINAVKRARNRRRSRRVGGGGGPNAADEELPREYQIMLFWAGLRGAVGFALSAGIEGQNATALQTTVLVTVVMTVIVFGGTTAQMLQILGIRTGVQDDENDSDDEEEEDDGALRLRGVRRRGREGYARDFSNNKWKDDSTINLTKYRDGSESSSPRNSYSQAEGARPRANVSSSLGHKAGKSRSFSDDTAAAEDDEDETSSLSSEVLPPTANPSLGGGLFGRSETQLPSLSEITRAAMEAGAEGSPARQLLDRAGLVMRDGQWFQKIDQKYLLPLFSNSVASRKHEQRKSARMAARAATGGGDPSGSGGGLAGQGNGSTRTSDEWDGTHQQRSGGDQSDLDLNTPTERDAEIVEEAEELDDDDGEGLILYDSSTLRPGSATGSSTPTRRFSSREIGSDDVNLTPSGTNQPSKGSPAGL
ncbi:sodium/hydrogen exchanger [Violaceomyces palustris]|uniref:Sodium/hydrogen exchanger n=1 Tax=Violaceomyces palustris TaxID=1673888 RepID=A0ACD0NQB4_9BASI|nr:sodium/hydrogen exchanger [Violaceomyces palustris]